MIGLGLAVALGAAAYAFYALALYLARALVRVRRGTDTLLPWATVLDDGITILTRDSALLRVFEAHGPDVLSSSDPELETLAEQAAMTLRQLVDTRWTIQVEQQTHLHPPPERPPCRHPRLETWIDARHRAFETLRHAVQRTFVTLTFRPTAQDLRTPAALDAAVESFRARTDALPARLSELRLEALGHDDLTAFLHTALTGTFRPAELDAALPLDPHPLRYGDVSIGALVLTGFPRTLHLGLADLGDVLTLPARWIVRARPLSPDHARRVFDERRRAWGRRRFNFSTVAAREFGLHRTRLRDDQGRDLQERGMTARVFQALRDAETELDGGDEAFFDVEHVLMLYATDRRDLDAGLVSARAELERRGLAVYEDPPTAVLTFLETLPGAGPTSATARLFSAAALARTLPLTQQWSGRHEVASEHFPSDSPPLLYAQVVGRPHLYGFDPHHQGCGHHLLIGPTGSGKSTLLAAEAVLHYAQYPRARVIICDYGGSARPLAALTGGVHYDLTRTTHTVNPLDGLNVPGLRHQAAQWLELTLALAGETLSARDRELVRSALDALALAPPQDWTLTHYRAHLQSIRLRQALDDYCREGPLGGLLDGVSPEGVDHAFTVWETERLLQYDERLALPVIAALLTRILRYCDERRPTLLALDEVWRLLRHPALREAIQEWLASFRKKATAVLLATQSPAQIPDPTFLGFIASQCPTRVYAPDRSAVHHAEAYQPLGLTEQQLSILAAAEPRSDYYVDSPEGRALITFNFRGEFLAALTQESPHEIQDAPHAHPRPHPALEPRAE